MVSLSALRGESKEEQAVCCVNAGGDTAHRKAVTTHSVANHAVKKLVSNVIIVVEQHKWKALNEERLCACIVA